MNSISLDAVNNCVAKGLQTNQQQCLKKEVIPICQLVYGDDRRTFLFIVLSTLATMSDPVYIVCCKLCCSLTEPVLIRNCVRYNHFKQYTIPLAIYLKTMYSYKGSFTSKQLFLLANMIPVRRHTIIL